MSTVLAGIISSVTGAVVAAVTSLLIVRYQLKRNLRNTTLLAIEEVRRQEKVKHRQDAVAATDKMLRISHDLLGSLVGASKAGTAREFIACYLNSCRLLEGPHKEVWLAAHKIPASFVDDFYMMYIEFQALTLDCREYDNRHIFRKDPSGNRWLEEHTTQLLKLTESLRRFTVRGFSWDQESGGDPDLTVHGPPTDYWPDVP